MGARYTSVIGLNGHAQNYIDAIEREYDVTEEEIVIGHGICDEEVYGSRWTYKARGLEYTITETVQDQPWDSGPNFLTYLKIETRSFGETRAEYECFRWMKDPTITNSYCWKTGRYWM